MEAYENEKWCGKQAASECSVSMLLDFSQTFPSVLDTEKQCNKKTEGQFLFQEMIIKSPQIGKRPT